MIQIVWVLTLVCSCVLSPKATSNHTSTASFGATHTVRFVPIVSSELGVVYVFWPDVSCDAKLEADEAVNEERAPLVLQLLFGTDFLAALVAGRGLGFEEDDDEHVIRAALPPEVGFQLAGYFALGRYTISLIIHIQQDVFSL